jgi:hypothetical protein
MCRVVTGRRDWEEIWKSTANQMCKREREPFTQKKEEMLGRDLNPMCKNERSMQMHTC